MVGKLDWKGLYVSLCLFLPFIFIPYGVLSKDIEPGFFDLGLMFVIIALVFFMMILFYYDK